ncbi:histone-lysine N-methyltransferase SETMAR-like [Vespa mandarinia]|uniref:histone-lysine N-methyltransferase SETMAR-like n=1 Tax=Vespa mandarinia TaxID=7446 RepID=UPI001608E725|nr:histone-lysine N-methyltransferase SETMAR-like [Vespa mandarinia]
MADEEHIRHCMLYEFQLGRKANEAAKNICNALGQDTVGVRKCQRWFKKFREGNFSLNDETGRGRVSNFDQETLQALLIKNPQITQQELATALNCSQKTICNQLRSLGKVQKFGNAQLEILDRALREKEPALINQNGVIFHHDNARPHTARIMAKKKLRQLG